ncbi:MAG: hypothetical protein WC254_04800 [Candidatus Woesearchaeota archaeon]|jgi:hypothetical protein
MISFVGIGWEKRLRRVRSNYTLSIAKDIILGNALRGGQALSYFLVRYHNRNAVLVFLDGKGVDISNEKQMDLRRFVMMK